MHKYVSLLTVVLLVCSCINSARARSAATSQYQQVNSVANDAAHKVSQEHDDDSSSDNTSNPGNNNMWKDLSMVYKIYQQCATENMSVCLKVKLLAGLERVFRADKALKIADGIQFVSAEPNTAGASGAVPKLTLPNEQDIEATLPRAADAKEFMLNNMIFKKIASFLQEHTLQIKFPDIRNSDAFISNDVEGRGKKKDKKGGGGAYIMIPLLLGGTFVPIAYGALAMLAGKALIVSKLALVLASIIGIKKLLSGGAKESSHEVVVSSGSHSGWGRDIDLAYNGWKPGNKDANKAH